MKKVTQMLTVLAVVAAGVLVAAAPASAYVLTGRFQNYATGYCLDSAFRASNSAFGRVYTLPCQAGNDHQTWEVTGPRGTSRFGYELVNVRNRATGLCLGMDEYGGPRLFTTDCGTSRAELEGVGTGWARVSLRQEWYENHLICVDTHGINEAYARACNDGNYQDWRLLS